MARSDMHRCRVQLISSYWLPLCVFVAVLPGHVRAWSVLVLGGTGFRGHPTTEYLARTGHNVTVLSRGLSYWGMTDQLRKRDVAVWKCNRTLEVGSDGFIKPETSGLNLCPELNASATPYFDVAIDFSSKNIEELKQMIKLLNKRIGLLVFMSSHAVYEVSKNTTHGDEQSFETDAVRPGRDMSPLDRFKLKEKSTRGNAALECEEELEKQYNAGGFPFVTFRLTNVIGPKENTIRYWLLHLWIRCHLALTFPMHLDETILETPISLTYTLDIPGAVERVIMKARNETCCPEHVEGEAFNLAAEQAPTQRTLYNLVGEPMGLPYIETQEQYRNASVVLYPEIVRGPVSIAKATSVLGWSPTDLSKALRSVARFYDRTMLDPKKYKRERELMYAKSKAMLGKEDGPRFVAWIRNYYEERLKTELYDEHDDEDEDDIVMARISHRKNKRRRSGSRKEGGEL